MADHVSPERRSAIMASVKGKNTQPELLIRSLIHSMGFRFRLHVATLPGTPDIVLPRHRKIVLINGCLWHGHKGCSRSTLPKSNVDFWKLKVATNIKRDKEVSILLRKQGWKLFTVWQCQMRSSVGLAELSKKLGRFLNS